MRKMICPYSEVDAWVGLPDGWLGEHANRRDEAVKKCNELNLLETNRKFAVSMALLEDWNIDGLNGNPDKWDFSKLDLRLIAWINEIVLADFGLCFAVPKVLLSPSPDGQTVTPTETLATGEKTAAT